MEKPVFKNNIQSCKEKLIKWEYVKKIEYQNQIKYDPTFVIYKKMCMFIRVCKLMCHLQGKAAKS